AAGYRLRKFARRNRARLVVAAGVFLALTVMTASIAWAVVRQIQIEQAEADRRAYAAGKVRDDWNAARTLAAGKKLAPARPKLAPAQAHLGDARPALGRLAAEVEAGAGQPGQVPPVPDPTERGA